MRKIFTLILVFALSLALAPQLAVTNAQSDGVPSVTVNDQFTLGSTVIIERAFSDGPGWVVIHTDNEGAPGPVAGFRHLKPGENRNIIVPIDTSVATPTLYAMLHTDTGEIGVYEFGTVEGADGPVSVDGNVVTPAFTAYIIDAKPQFINNGTFTADYVTIDTAGWLVIHAESEEGRPGAVLGFAPLSAGNNAGVTVSLEGEFTNRVWPMLHVDTGTEGEYEFGAVEGADGPVTIGERVATAPVPTVPTILATPQVLIHSDNAPMDDSMMEGEMMEDDMAPTFRARGVLSEGLGWLVIHADGGGAPGPVIGFTQVQAGFNPDVTVALDAEGLTPVVYPMLHVDTGTEGEYEFGSVEGADGPVSVDDRVVTFPVLVAPNFLANPQPIVDGTIRFDSILADAPGWIVIHSSVDGAPGPVLGFAQLHVGANQNVFVTIEDPSTVEGAATDQVFPMLHYDTGEAGAYEFGSVEGADGPVTINGEVVVGPLSITAE